MPPRDARFGYACYQNTIKGISESEFAIGHPVYDELLTDGFYHIDGYLTKSPNYGVKISDTPIIPGKKGNN